MPCRDYREDFPQHNDCSDERDENERLKARADDLARMLCVCCRELHSEFDEMPNEEIAEWWERHQRNDRLALVSKMESKVDELLEDFNQEELEYIRDNI